MALPSNKIVTYKARETPSDPNSEVLIEHKLHIAAQTQDGDNVTWKINKLTFIQLKGASWTKNWPGLEEWVVTHVDPEDPAAGDFTNPPALSGTATEHPGTTDDLNYAFNPGSCSGSDGQMYGGAVVCTEYSYVAGAETIAEEDEDEPTEIESEDDPS